MLSNYSFIGLWPEYVSHGRWLWSHQIWNVWRNQMNVSNPRRLWQTKKWDLLQNNGWIWRSVNELCRWDVTLKNRQNSTTGKCSSKDQPSLFNLGRTTRLQRSWIHFPRRAPCEIGAFSLKRRMSPCLLINLSTASSNPAGSFCDVQPSKIRF